MEGIFDDDDGDAKEKIRREVQLAWGLVAEKDNSSPQFKQQLMSLLRYRGFDAGQYYTIYLNYSYQLSYSIFHFVCFICQTTNSMVSLKLLYAKLLTFPSY